MFIIIIIIIIIMIMGYIGNDLFSDISPRYKFSAIDWKAIGIKCFGAF